jgi:hypothetical protein
MTKRLSSIVDVPKKAGSEDLFGISKYESGLIEFIRNSDTPITIAIQGEWGSGKTSLMNSLQNILCGDLADIENHQNEFYGIWVNTWQYSLLNSQEETLISIVSSISTQIMQIISSRHQGLGEKIAGTMLGFLNRGIKAATSIAAEKIVEGGGDVVTALLSKEKTSQSIKSLRDELQVAINDCLEKDNKINSESKKGFIFFIDDLDRIDPPAAVQILELLKNIFDLENCIFILAIDYDVVVKGLKPKFGELTEKNEREFRSFFDKIIQMPFSMPVASYSIDQFLINNLVRIGYLNQEKAANQSMARTLSSFCSLSVGTNPRSLKRLLNTVSLITIIINQEEEDVYSTEEDYRLQINFALICLQIAYPVFYKTLSMESDFRSWNENLARQLKLRELTEIEMQKLSDSEEFDEEWEQIVFRICERDNFLSNRAVQVSQLFNMIYKLVPEGETLGNIISELLALSSVTDVQAFDKPRQAINKGPILKSLAASIVPILRSHLRKPWPVVRQQSKKIQSNVFISFSSENWADCIGLSVEAIKDYVVLLVWFHPWAFKIKGGSLKEDISSVGMQAEMENLSKEYKAFIAPYGNASFRFEPLMQSGTAKGWHVPHLTIQISFPNPESVLEKSNLEKTAEIIMNFMDVNAKLKDFYGRYNKTVSK